MKKRLAVFLDGTWNDPGTGTNVFVLSQRCAGVGADGIEQRARYDDGVGTKWHQRFRGGLFGYGISDKISDAYQWLVDNYEDGDEIYLFGFSRGAYTARSLAGIIARRGLLTKESSLTVDDVFELYRSSSSRKLADGAARVPIHFIGVFDTVGELGVPLGPIRHRLSRIGNYFHNHHPSVQYRHMVHAVAIDEHRPPYEATLWTRYVPDGVDEPEPLEPDQTVEQRWFVGAHTNVGGGESTQLEALPLAWIQAEATRCGLAFDAPFEAAADAHAGKVKDSFGSFLGGLYRFVKRNKRYYRTIGEGATAVKSGKGQSLPINESIDASVFAKYQSEPGYRPKNLVAWAAKNDVDLDQVDATLKVGVQL